jgi:hypothetical protein
LAVPLEKGELAGARVHICKYKNVQAFSSKENLISWSDWPAIHVFYVSLQSESNKEE